MTRYTASHWGIYEIHQEDTGPRLAPFQHDPDPSDIGLHQLDPGLDASRVQHPSVRKSWLTEGPGARPDLRGRDEFVEVDWTVALDLAAGEIDRVRKTYGNSAIFGGSYGWSSAGRFHHAQSQVHRFLNSVGGYVAHRDSYSLGAGRVLMPHIVAPMDRLMSEHTSWSVMAEHTELFVTFGGVPEKNAQISAGGVGDHRIPAGLRAMAASGTKFVNISPVRDNLETGGPVEWIPIRPNTDTAMMLALAWVLWNEDLLDRGFLTRCCEGFDIFERYLSGATDGQPKTPEWAAEITGVPAEQMISLARRMASSRCILNSAWALQRADHGEQPFWMVVTLACMLGQIGTPGGGFGLGYGATNTMGSPHIAVSGPTLSQGSNAVKDFIPVARISDMLLSPGSTFTYQGGVHTYPEIQLVYWAGGNPFHHHQDLGRLEQALRRPSALIVNEQFWTATAKFADIVFPVTTTTERRDIGSANREGYLVPMTAARPPYGAARDDFDIFTDLADRLGARDVYTEGLDSEGWLRRIYREWQERAITAGIQSPSFDTFMAGDPLDFSSLDKPVVMLESFAADPVAAPLRTPSGRIEIYSATIAGFQLSDCPGHPVWIPPAEWLGAAEVAQTPLHMLSDQPARRLHSQLDPSPYSRANKVAGREPICMHPDDAAARGIADGDVVEVFNSRGRTLAGARVTDAMMPGVVRLSTGAWFDRADDQEPERHGNPNTLTRDRGASGLSQGCTAQTCLVEVRGPVNDAPRVTAFERPEFARA